MSESASGPSPRERLVVGVSFAVTAALVGTVFGTYVYGANTSPNHTAVGSVLLQAPEEDVLALLHDMPRRPSWRPDVVRIAQRSDATDDREVWRELDAGDDRFDFEVVARPERGLVIRTDAAEQIGYEATWTFAVEPTGEGTRVVLTEEAFVDNPLFRGLFWLRGGPQENVRDELALLGKAVDGTAPPVEELTVIER